MGILLLKPISVGGKEDTDCKEFAKLAKKFVVQFQIKKEKCHGLIKFFL